MRATNGAEINVELHSEQYVFKTYTKYMQDITVEVSDAVALFNQTLDYAYPSITIVGELANLRVSRNKWVYFDLKDDYASLKFFGTVFALPGPLEDGMKLAVVGRPHIHELYGFSVQVQSITPVGEGAIKKAAELLARKLQAEGLFDVERKRRLPYPPKTIGLITAEASAAYADFIKILGARYGGVQVLVRDVQVQGEPAVASIVSAITQFNEMAQQVDVLVITRGGGSADDLAAFSTEQVVRAVAGSRIPTLVAIGHEIDESLAELAADARASTPSNAAELLVPDRREVIAQLRYNTEWLAERLTGQLQYAKQHLKEQSLQLTHELNTQLQLQKTYVVRSSELLEALNPHAALRRGYAMVRTKGALVRSVHQAPAGTPLQIQLNDGQLTARVE